MNIYMYIFIIGAAIFFIGFLLIDYVCAKINNRGDTLAFGGIYGLLVLILIITVSFFTMNNKENQDKRECRLAASGNIPSSEVLEKVLHDEVLDNICN